MPFEDLYQDFTLVDAENKITPIANRMNAAGVPRNEDTYFYSDKGVNFFNGDFTHKFQTSDIGASGALAYVYVLANAIDDVKGLEDADEDFIALRWHHVAGSAVRLTLQISDDGVVSSHGSGNLGEGTTYYVTITRDDDGGVNSTGQVTATIRTGSHAGPTVVTLTLDCGVGEQNDYRYIYPFASYNDGNTQVANYDVKNLTLTDTENDFEDLANDYTAVDPNSRLAVNSRALLWSSFLYQTVAYAYKDYGVNHFNGDFTHLVTLAITTESQAPICSNYMLSNDLDVLANQTNFQGLYYQNDSALLYVMEDGSPSTDGPIAWADPLTYYVTFDRDDDGGVNGTGKVTAYFRTGSHEGILVDTLTVDCGIGFQVDWRYILTPVSRGTGSGTTVSGWTQELDLQEIIAGIQIMNVMAYAGMHNVIIGGVILR